ncbi:GNAT family N-acetyltransferase [Priestia taiwanensis]|uniref:N-acetyltransferase n=1 Tax=Priestia taiwanensis TaxID=1347902 RepID=A0A917AMQ7_9BACI|nr:GNAT family N-acetyltransferase [Priestia taiwanensis]MBM7362456.1 ribosomal protein S18 acetylase RimI-like enzyme [Priestia taiwanensis]GGE62350.1 N-acetyltransferase [Priestia taiwanensis]
MKIKEVTELLYSEQEELIDLLIDVVAEGASLGFHDPVQEEIARTYWANLLKKGVILFVAYDNNELVGTVQLHVCNRENGLHRGEVAKLMVHPNARRKGVAHRLMRQLEEKAKQKKCTLLVLDTRAGDGSNDFYQTIGYTICGRIPKFTYSLSENVYHDTVLYYKEIGE